MFNRSEYATDVNDVEWNRWYLDWFLNKKRVKEYWKENSLKKNLQHNKTNTAKLVV